MLLQVKNKEVQIDFPGKRIIKKGLKTKILFNLALASDEILWAVSLLFRCLS